MPEDFNKIENIFHLLKSGEPLNVIISKYPELKNEAQILSSLKALPKKPAPQPVMQRKYILAAEKIGKLSWLHFPRMVIAGSLSMIIVIASVGAGVAASASVPGDTLFAVKRSAEQIRIRLTPSPEAKANLQVKLSKKRFSEAQKVLSDPSVKPEKTQAALSELVGQNKETLAAVETVVKENPNSEKTASVLYTLETLTSKQQELINDLNPQDNSQALQQTEQAFTENAAKLTEMKKIVEIASAEKEPSENATSSPEQIITSTGPATNTPSTIKGTSTAAAITTSTSTSLNANTSTEESDEALLKDFQKPQVTGGFIIEDPTPQFAP